jgi:hypothetical protein
MNAIPMIVRCAANQSKGAPTACCIRCGRPAWFTAEPCLSCVLKAMFGHQLRARCVIGASGG